ncbi:hypothetical protein GW17_00008140 [Ensete ventricosum]|nr:hypothetical protein GW17_00008140 [Ensete ventricosum]RZR76115.1 hypothetical protein BHM03_00000738 [Ensete ventricosum]
MACFCLSRGQAGYYLIAHSGFRVGVDEIELVEILRGILSASRGVKDMNEAWLVEAGLSPAPLRVGDSIDDQRVRPVGVAVSTAEKHPSNDVGASLRKRSKRAAPEEPADASGSTIEALTKKGRESDSKGKEPTEFEEVPEWGYSIRDLCEVEDRAGTDG